MGPYIMSKKKSISYLCNICGTESKILGIKRGVRAVLCPLCGFIWKDTQSLPDDYRETWRYGSQESFEVRNRDNVYDYRLKKILEKSRREVKKIMDFGCDKGGFVKYLRAKGYEAYGCDLGGNIPEDPFFFRKNIADVHEYDFDVIVSIETFEHIEELKTIVAELVKRLRKGGMLYIETQFTHVGSVLGWGYFDLTNHVSFHSPNSMKKLMDNSGVDLMYFDNKKQPKDILWLMRKLIHISHKVIPYFVQKSRLYESIMRSGVRTAKTLFGKKVVVEPCKDWVTGVLELSNCVFVGLKR